MKCKKQQLDGCGRVTEETLRQLGNALYLEEAPIACRMCVDDEKPLIRGRNMWHGYHNWCPPGIMVVDNERPEQ